MVGEDRFRSDCDQNSNDAKEHVDKSPPRVVRILAMDLGDDGSYEGNEPGDLCHVSEPSPSSQSPESRDDVRLLLKKSRERMGRR